MRHHHRLNLSQLERRDNPAWTGAISGTSVSFLGDAAGDGLVLQSDAGLLSHNLGGLNGFDTATDMDSSVPGTQAIAIAAITSLVINGGGGEDSLFITDVAAPASISVENLYWYAVDASTANADATLSLSALTITDVPVPYMYGISGLSFCQLSGGIGPSLLDASAVNYSVLLSGGDGNDTLLGGSFDDHLTGGAGVDVLSARAGADFIEDIDGFAVVDGGDGFDQFVGYEIATAIISDGNLLLNGAAAGLNRIETFVLYGTIGPDTINAMGYSLGSITAFGGPGDDLLRGGSGSDALYGQDGADTLEGLGGADLLAGGPGLDIILAGDGDDQISADDGDSIDGGAGFDILFAFNITNALATNTTLILNAASGPNNCERLEITGTGSADVIDCSGFTVGSCVLRGLGGPDILKGGAGNDTLLGGSGANELHGFNGNDAITGGSIGDTIFGGQGDDNIDGAGGQDVVDGGPGHDFFRSTGIVFLLATDSVLIINAGPAGDNNLETLEITGTNADDGFFAANWSGTTTWLGLGGNDVAEGGAGNDFLFGGDGNDTLRGGGGHDTLFLELGGAQAAFGGPGDDALIGGPGHDTLEGGAGVDFFLGHEGNDLLRDGGNEANSFDAGLDSDTLELSATAGPDVIAVDTAKVIMNGQSNSYLGVEILAIDAGDGIDSGTQIPPVHPLPYTVANLEPTVNAGPDAISMATIFQRTGSFIDIGAGQSWTAEANYGDGTGWVSVPVNQSARTFSLSHAYTSGGHFTVQVRVRDHQNSVGDNAFLLTRPAGLLAGNPSGKSASVVTSLTVLFSEIVTLNPGYFSFTGTTSPIVTPTVTVVGSQTQIVFTFSSTVDAGASLLDGSYGITLIASNIVVTATSQLFDGDGDGAPGGDFNVNFHRLFGDDDGNGTVDASDFAAFGASFGIASPGFDHDANGAVDGADFAQFGARFGLSV